MARKGKKSNRFRNEKKKYLYSCGKPLPLYTSLEDAEEAFEKRIQKMKEGKERKFTDKAFPADLSALFCDEQKPSKAIIPVFEDIRWMRISDMVEETKDWPDSGRVTNPQLFVGGTAPGDVNQGILGNCWFVSALSVLAIPKRKNKDEMSPAVKYLFCQTDRNPIITAKDSMKYGLYVIRIFKEDMWVYVIIDDLLPVVAKWGTLAFCHSKDPNEFWVALLEKAYAKVHGSYEALCAGEVHYGLRDLTGGVPIEINIKTQMKNKNLMENMWNDMKRYHAEKAMMGCASGGDDDRKSSNTGIVQGHAYAILNVIEVVDDKKHHLVVLRNPHGDKSVEWNGAWSDANRDSRESKWTHYPGAKRHVESLGYDFEETGPFIMDFNDFCSEFKTLWVLRHLADDNDELEEPPESPYKKLRQNKWAGPIKNDKWGTKTSAGWFPANKKEWWRNPQFQFEIKGAGRQKTSEVVILIAQQDMKMARGGEFNKFNFIGFAVIQCKNLREGQKYGVGPNPVSQKDIKHVSAMSWDREVALNLTLECGVLYTIIPWTRESGIHVDFTLKIYHPASVDTTELTNVNFDDEHMDYADDQDYDSDKSSEYESDGEGTFEEDRDVGVQSAMFIKTDSVTATTGSGARGDAGGGGGDGGGGGSNLQYETALKQMEKKLDDTFQDMRKLAKTFQQMAMHVSYEIPSNLAVGSPTRGRGRGGAPRTIAARGGRSTSPSVSPVRRPYSAKAGTSSKKNPQRVYEQMCRENNLKLNSGINLRRDQESFDFSKNYLGVNGVVPLIQALDYVDRITCLNFSSQDLDDECCAQLVNVLKGHPELTTLCLSRTQIGPESEDILLDLIEGNTALVKFEANHTGISDYTPEILVRAVERNKEHWDHLKEAASLYMSSNDPSALLSLIR